VGTNSNAIIEPEVLEKLRQLGGDALLSEMFDLFTSHAESLIEKAVRGFELGEPNLLRQAVHSLKSSAGNLGACRLQALAERIETLMDSSRMQEVRLLLAELQDAYAAAKSELAGQIR
jgi:HPt (histidine-containing phosphotransfer) domain-containing protein